MNIGIRLKSAETGEYAPYGGLIRCHGGKLHNQFVNLRRWMLNYRPENDGMVYRLHRMTLPTGAVFWEYIVYFEGTIDQMYDFLLKCEASTQGS